MTVHQKPAPDDPRRMGQDKVLARAHLVRRKYRPPRHSWDHDHCEFCFATFSLCEGDLKEGYCTPDEYHWICPECFEDFSEEFGWILDESPG